VVLHRDELSVQSAVSQGGAKFLQHVVHQKLGLLHQISVSLEVELKYSLFFLGFALGEFLRKDRLDVTLGDFCVLIEVFEDGQADVGIQCCVVELRLFEGSSCPVTSLLVLAHLLLQEFLGEIGQGTIALLRMQLFEEFGNVNNPCWMKGLWEILGQVLQV
jgi:hypothetical protein